MAKKYINTVDILTDQLNNPQISTLFSGFGKPDILYWETGADTYAAADSGSITKDCVKLIVYNPSDNPLLLSIGDISGQEKPYIIPNNFVREIILPYEVKKGARVVIKNLNEGEDVEGVYIEFC